MAKKVTKAVNKHNKATRKVQRLEAREARRNPKVIDSQFESGRKFGIDQGLNWDDPTTNYANSFDNYIWFESTIGGPVIKFKAMLTQFEDQFNSEWNSEQVYGRNDPIQTFRNTTRKISIGWDAPAGSFAEAATNMLNAAELTRMLYPSYLDQGSVSTINKAPMIKVKLRNLIQGYDGEELLVTLDGLTFSPDLEAGWFDINENVHQSPNGKFRDPPPFKAKKELVPKLLKFSCTMTVLHQTTIGYNASNNWPSELSRFPNLPYGYNKAFLDASAIVAETARSPTNFEAEEEAKFDKAMEKATDEAAGDAPELSTKQKKRQENKEDRQAKRTRILEENIVEAQASMRASALGVVNASRDDYNAGKLGLKDS